MFAREDAARLEPPPGPGVLAVNPPFGVRLADEAAGSWRAIAALLERSPGWVCAVLAPDRGLERLLGRRPLQAVHVRNGGLACRLLLFEA